MLYLREVGPDTMIPCFSVNLKGNKSVDLCNAINMALFQDLCHASSEQTAHRIPMIVTASSLVPPLITTINCPFLTTLNCLACEQALSGVGAR